MTVEPAVLREPPLQSWSRGHALAMLVGLGACQRGGAAWPCALLAAPSFAIFIALSRCMLTPSGRFGLANAVTSLRLLLVLGLTAPPAWLTTGAAIAATVASLLLDLLDGWLARSRGDASAFGGHFDMEVDALLVLVVTLRLWLVEGYGPWALLAGALRYSYVLFLWLCPGTGREAPRSQFGRYAFSILMLGLLGGLSLRGTRGVACVVLGTLVVSASFARSVYFAHSTS